MNPCCSLKKMEVHKSVYIILLRIKKSGGAVLLAQRCILELIWYFVTLIVELLYAPSMDRAGSVGM